MANEFQTRYTVEALHLANTCLGIQEHNIRDEDRTAW